jgi:bifunctional DNA-binding transcriptional regulator/antitoxin component of YhaV-PrlF toxin-antitoxin module
MRTTLTVDDDGVLTFPDELIEKLGWKEGDVLQWIDNKDGSFSLVKPDDV